MGATTTVSHMIILQPDEAKTTRYAKAVKDAGAFAGFDVETIGVVTNFGGSSRIIECVDKIVRCDDKPWVGPAHDAALAASEAEFYVYTCANHMQFRKLSWLQEMIAPLQGGADASGDVRPIGFGPPALQMGDRFGDHPKYRTHLQGGLWAGRVDVLRQYPYCARFPQGYEDVYRSWCLIEAGRRMEHVPTIFSTGVRTHTCHSDEAYSIIHDYRVDDTPYDYSKDQQRPQVRAEYRK